MTDMQPKYTPPDISLLGNEHVRRDWYTFI